jgi:hypothetical protein
MTRRERLENKIDRRRDWAASAESKSTAAFNTAHNLVKDIPMGQPILIGHHSEGRHRRTLERSDSAMRKACEMSAKAENHISKAANLEHALDKTIFSDDIDATEALTQRIADNEAERARMVLINKLYRKGNAEGLKAIDVDLESLKVKLAAAGSYWGSAPYLPYSMTNLGARIREDKKRLENIKAMHRRQAEAAETEDGVTVKQVQCGPTLYASVTFSEKPAYSVIRELKDAGFRWGAGRWFGQFDKLPASVNELVA